MKPLSSTPEVEKQRSPPRVKLAQWLLAFISVLMGGYSYYVTNYDYLAIVALILAAVNFVLVLLVAKEALNSRLIGKFCLMAGALVFYWLDAVSLALQKIPFTIPNGFPVQGERFDPAGFTIHHTFSVLSPAGLFSSAASSWPGVILPISHGWHFIRSPNRGL